MLGRGVKELSRVPGSIGFTCYLFGLRCSPPLQPWPWDWQTTASCILHFSHSRSCLWFSWSLSLSQHMAYNFHRICSQVDKECMCKHFWKESGTGYLCIHRERTADTDTDFCQDVFCWWPVSKSRLLMVRYATTGWNSASCVFMQLVAFPCYGHSNAWAVNEAMFTGKGHSALLLKAVSNEFSRLDTLPPSQQCYPGRALWASWYLDSPCGPLLCPWPLVGAISPQSPRADVVIRESSVGKYLKVYFYLFLRSQDSRSVVFQSGRH